MSSRDKFDHDHKDDEQAEAYQSYLSGETINIDPTPSRKRILEESTREESSGASDNQCINKGGKMKNAKKSQGKKTKLHDEEPKTKI